MKGGRDRDQSSDAILLFLIVSLFLSDRIEAQGEPLNKGKTLRVIVGFSPGGAYDIWARMIAKHLGRYIPENPILTVQNMPGAGSITAANYLTSIAKPDGLTIGLIASALYFDQMIGRTEVNFSWGKLTWIGTPERTSEMLYMRSDAPFKTIDELRQASEAPKCWCFGDRQQLLLPQIVGRCGRRQIQRGRRLPRGRRHRPRG